MSKKWRLSVLLLSFYALGLFLAAVIFSVVTFSLLRQQRVQYIYWPATIARATLFPFQVIAPPQSLMKLWDHSLALAQLSPALYQDSQKVIAQLQGSSTLDQPQLESLAQQLTESQLLVTNIHRNLSQESWLKRQLFTSQQLSYDEVKVGTQDLVWLSNVISASLSEYQRSFETPEPQRYLVLLQNNKELRPSGGFMGSYAEVVIANGQLINFEVQDIYVPDGQLVGHVEPPQPIQAAFQQGFWKLRDANWHPDFEKSANNVEWFYEQAMGRSVDGIVAINYSTVEELLAVLGPIYLPDYQQEIAADSLYEFLQREVESNFFPGSTKKRDLLSSLTRQLQFKLQTLTLQQSLQLLAILHQAKKEQNLQVHFDYLPTQRIFQRLQMTGKLLSPDCGPNCFGDMFAIFEANLGVNKSNCCVERSITIDKRTATEDTLQSTIAISYWNPGPPPELRELAGSYKSYVRIYVPIDTQITNLQINNQSYQSYVEEQVTLSHFSPITPTAYSEAEVQGLKEIGLWIFGPEQKSTEVQLTTLNTYQQINAANLLLQKQSGVLEKFNQYTISFNGNQLFTGPLSTTQQLGLFSSLE